MTDTRTSANNNSIRAFVLLMVLGVLGVRAVGAFDASIMVGGRALATSTTSCTTETEACSSDSTCVDCLDEYASNLETCTSANGSPETCDDLEDIVCCTISGESSCSSNDAFEDFLSCAFEEACPIDIGGCTSSEATTDNSMSTECPDETDACVEDASCIDCLEEFTASMDGCLATSGTPGTCGELEELVCCAIEPGVACESNEAVSDFLACAFEDTCIIDIGLCTSSGGATTTGDDEDSTTIDGSDIGGGLFLGGDDDKGAGTGIDALTSSALRAAGFAKSAGVALSLTVAAVLWNL